MIVLCWGYFRDMLGVRRGYVEGMLRVCWGYVGDTLGICWGVYGYAVCTLGYFLWYVGGMWR